MIPRLKNDHPGYFLVAIQILLIHGGLGIDALINHHTQPQWVYVNQFIGFVGWAVIHFAVLIAGVVGLYMHRIHIMRSAWFASYLSFVILGIELLIGVHQSGQSYALPVLLFAASLSSLAAMREDPINPAMRGGALTIRGSITKVTTTPVPTTIQPKDDLPARSVDTVLNSEPADIPLDEAV